HMANWRPGASKRRTAPRRRPPDRAPARAAPIRHTGAALDHPPRSDQKRYGMNLHQTFTAPPPSQRADLTMKDGAVIRLRRYGRPGATRLVLSHGNGLAINAYAPFWLPLAESYDLVVFDMRNHGENPLHTQEGHVWESFFSDIEEIFQGIKAQFG